MYEDLIVRLKEDKSWVEQGTTQTEHEIAEHIQQAADAIEELNAYCDNMSEAFATLEAIAPQWIPVSERLPDDRQIVLAYWGSIHCEHSDNFSIMRFCKGKTADEVDPYKGIGFCDQWGNNKAPYAWADPHGPLKLFGQNVTYWMPLPEPPKDGENINVTTKKDGD